MRVWVDLANSPHVAFFAPVVAALEADGHEVVLSARAHAQTVELARRRWPGVAVVGGESPRGRLAKAGSVMRRAAALRSLARAARPDVALSHGSYAQLAASRSLRLPSVTLMDYEHQPANHVSFRLANRVIVPDTFPEEALRRCGVRPARVRRYEGFKEEVYLAGFAPDEGVLAELGLDRSRVLAVFRTPPDEALYHGPEDDRFDSLLARAAADPDVQVVLLPRTASQRRRLDGRPGVVVPERAVDALSLLAFADVTVGAGGTMSRESALLGTPTYTVFSGRLAAVDAALIRLGFLHDLRAGGDAPLVPKVSNGHRRAELDAHARALVELVARTLAELA